MRGQRRCQCGDRSSGSHLRILQTVEGSWKSGVHVRAMRWKALDECRLGAHTQSKRRPIPASPLAASPTPSAARTVASPTVLSPYTPAVRSRRRPPHSAACTHIALRAVRLILHLPRVLTAGSAPSPTPLPSHSRRSRRTSHHRPRRSKANPRARRLGACPRSRRCTSHDALGRTTRSARTLSHPQHPCAQSYTAAIDDSSERARWVAPLPLPSPPLPALVHL
jgi:hypothetical protein